MKGSMEASNEQDRPGGSLARNQSINSLNKLGPSDYKSDQTKPNMLVRLTREIFGYRKTTLTFLVVLTLLSVFLVVPLERNLDFTVELPGNGIEADILRQSWSDLQRIGLDEHPYGSERNDEVRDYLEGRIADLIRDKRYIEYDDDLNYRNVILYNTENADSSNTVTYYESDNLLVRVNGSNSDLPALLVSAHYDSVPTSFGITDDGMGIASLLGLLQFYSAKLTKQPERTIIFNFNNNEEFGLFGARAFLSHPWAKQVAYFLNLEGTGAGGKAILFRGTDYGIVKFYKNVRFPFASSLFQQGFNNRLVHSETDYKIYKELGGLRGIDIAFYKPRDLYHTAGDNIKNIDIKALWHMLSSSLDFVGSIVSSEIDLDKQDDSDSNKDLALYTSFFNWFFAISVSRLLVLNILAIVIVPIASIPLMFIIIRYKRDWNVGLINLIKYPVALIVTFFVLKFIAQFFVRRWNQFAPNNSSELLLITFTGLSLTVSYAVLNGINLVFKHSKGLNHDEKLIVIIENSLLFWIALAWSTFKLSYNKPGDDHTGELFLVFLSVVQALGAFIGLLGWTFKKPHKHIARENDEANEPLLNEEGPSGYGASEDADVVSHSSHSHNSIVSNEISLKATKYFSYDWFIQYLIVTPISFLILYESGSLLLDGLNKTIQESYLSEKLIYKFITVTALALLLPIAPFVFKLNRVFIILAIFLSVIGLITTIFTDPFNEANPLKLRFLQSINIEKNAHQSEVNVYGRLDFPISDILDDLPSVKEEHAHVSCSPVADGVGVCSYNSTLLPQLTSNATSAADYLEVEVLKNSSSESKHPFGLLTGEIEIKALKNRMCKLSFDTLQDKSNSKRKSNPVKLVKIYKTKPFKSTEDNSEHTSLASLPDGYSLDSKGNHIFKDLNGIDLLDLNKLNWDDLFHVSFQWIPGFLFADSAAEFTSDSNDVSMAESTFLNVTVDCFWAALGHIANDKQQVVSLVPAYEELLHYSPNYISWTNKEEGLVSITKTVAFSA